MPGIGRLPPIQVRSAKQPRRPALGAPTRRGHAHRGAHDLLLSQHGDTPHEPTGALHPVRVAPTDALKRTQSSLWAAAIILAPLDDEEVNWGSALTCRHLERGSPFVQPISQGRKKMELANRCIYQ